MKQITITLPGSEDAIKNEVICPEDILRIALLAREIPDKAKVSFGANAKSGMRILRKNIPVYTIIEFGAPQQFIIAGYFLIDEEGEVEQIKGDTILHWHIAADDFVDLMKKSWANEEHK